MIYKFCFPVFNVVFSTAFSAYHVTSVPFSIFNFDNIIGISICIDIFYFVPANTSESYSQRISYILHTCRHMYAVLFSVLQFIFCCTE